MNKEEKAIEFPAIKRLCKHNSKGSLNQSLEDKLFFKVFFFLFVLEYFFSVVKSNNNANRMHGKNVDRIKCIMSKIKHHLQMCMELHCVNRFTEYKYFYNSLKKCQFSLKYIDSLDINEVDSKKNTLKNNKYRNSLLQHLN